MGWLGTMILGIATFPEGVEESSTHWDGWFIGIGAALFCFAAFSLRKVQKIIQASRNEVGGETAITALQAFGIIESRILPVLKSLGCSRGHREIFNDSPESLSSTYTGESVSFQLTWVNQDGVFVIEYDEDSPKNGAACWIDLILRRFNLGVAGVKEAEEIANEFQKEMQHYC